MKTGTRVAIVAGVATVVLIALVLCCLYRRQKRTLVGTLQSVRLLDGQAMEDVLEQHAAEVDSLREAWRIDPSELKLEKFLAAGGEGRVYKGTWRRGIKVAIKLMPRDPDSPQNHGFSNREIQAMQRLRGTRLVHFYGVGDCALRDLPVADAASVQPGATTTGSKPVAEAVSTLPVLSATREGDDENTWDFVVIELCEGGSLSYLLDQAAEAKDASGEDSAMEILPWHRRLEILRDVAEGVHVLQW